MSERVSQSKYEKLVAALLVVGMAVVGWGPFALESLRLPFIERFLLPETLAFAVISLGLLYDATERLLGVGRGLYAGAIFCTIPASGMVAADPGMLADAALMLFCAVGIWMASRAGGEERPYFLIFMAVLLFAGGYAFGFQPAALVFVFVAWLAARQGSKVRVWVAILLMSYAAGTVAHELLPFSLPVPRTILPPKALTVWDMSLPLLPWALFIVPAISTFRTRLRTAQAWWSDAAAVLLLTVITALVGGTSVVKSAAAAAPMIALLGADIVTTDFRTEFAPAWKRLTALPYALAALALLLLPLVSSLHWIALPVVTTGQAILCVILATALAWTVVHNLPRWSFVLAFAAGILFGRFANQSEPLLPDPNVVKAQSVSPLAFLMMLGAAIAVWVFFHLRARRDRNAQPDGDYLFSGENFRNFSNLKSDGQGGCLVPVGEALDDRYRFVIFGDVTGAESPFSARRSGFFAFRTLIRKLAETHPAFAISLGDLASQATRTSYQRIHKLLRQIPVPLAVTPGNHDLLAEGEREHRYFHELFGADNAVFRIGPVQFVILNNGWGSIQPQQFAWLESVLPPKPAPFTLVFCHKPVFELRPDEFYAMDNREHAERFHAILKERGATAVFSGHIHSLLSGERDGVVYVISGGGGSKLLSDKDQFHYLEVDVSPEELVVRALPLTNRAGGDASPLLELRFSPRS